MQERCSLMKSNDKYISKIIRIEAVCITARFQGRREFCSFCHLCLWEDRAAISKPCTETQHALKCNRVDSSQGPIYPVSPSYELIPFLGWRGVAPALCSGIFTLSHSKSPFPCWWFPTSMLWELLPRVDGWDRFLLQITENRQLHRCWKLKQL